jgi:putative endonuclease
MSKTTRQLLGIAGERHARRHLEARGFQFCAANWRGAGGEIDLIMRHGDELVFVEVKTRRGDGLGRAEESVSVRQQQTLLTAAEAFIAAHPENDQMVWRIDLIAITLDARGTVSRLSHVENSVGW